MIPRALPGSVVPLVMAAVLNLFPPGWGSKSHPPGSPPPRIPAALAGGSRVGGFRSDVSFPMRAVVSPSPARLGEALTYRAHVIVSDGARAVFSSPDTGGAFTWGPASMGRVSLDHVPKELRGAIYRADSVWLEIPLQVFATGSISIPGPAVKLVPESGVSAPIRSRFPTLHLIVLPTITAADSNVTLRAVHGPLGAPWWERVPWRVVTAVALLVVALAALALWWRRRRRRPLSATGGARRVAPPRDPAEEALSALARLRDHRLPEQGRMGEHAQELTRILRRYLEATQGSPRPGDTSRELVARLRTSRLTAEDLERLEGLLGLWDRVKFARAPLTAAEAHRCETAVEQLVRRRDAREVA